MWERTDEIVKHDSIETDSGPKTHVSYHYQMTTLIGTVSCIRSETGETVVLLLDEKEWLFTCDPLNKIYLYGNGKNRFDVTTLSAIAEHLPPRYEVRQQVHPARELPETTT